MLSGDVRPVQDEVESSVTQDATTLLYGIEPRLRRALVARYGLDVGAEATAEAIAWGWEHAAALAAMTNPVGYLDRVGQSAARRTHRLARVRAGFPTEPRGEDAPDLAGDVFDELSRLRPSQRVAVLLIHGYGFSYRDVAQLLDVSEAAVTNHVHRGLRKLRARLESKP